MKYRLVTGYYPSRATAEKVLNKVKGNCAAARVEPFEECFVVILYETNSYDKVDSAFSKFMKLKVYCGIQQMRE